MLIEFKRSIFSIRFLTAVVISVLVLVINAYIGGWKDAFSASSAVDLSPENTKWLIESAGNKYKLWRDAFQALQVIIPILITVPYFLTYIGEMNTNFRYMIISKIGQRKYVFRKAVAIAFSSAIAITLGELIFLMILNALAITSMDPEHVSGLMFYLPNMFSKSPDLYIFYITGLRFMYYLAVTIFSLGITSSFKSKIAAVIFPFIVITVIDTVLGMPVSPYSANTLVVINDMSLANYGVIVIGMFFTGCIFIAMRERKNLIYG